MCPAQDPDIAWYTKIETCLTPLPEVSSEEEVAGGQLKKWPKRLQAIPPRISRGTVTTIDKCLNVVLIRIRSTLKVNLIVECSLWLFKFMMFKCFNVVVI
ncbi:probable methyltransferase PMT14 [Lycium barbarum]|uniref:probable methyltransferase PMT14 n=1 Tax=Lycium barbarum TaxID=112863 RepID=UPI00293E6008|nr:probable methyltransferase PMT14 [Lycium barbarum]